MNKSSHISEKDSFLISVIRNTAACLIILCHICSESQSFSFLGQVFNVGIYVFFALSGFIYARKEISNISNWLAKRFFRLVIPCYVYYILSYLLLICMGKAAPLNAGNVLIVALNLQGFVTGGFGGVIISHLWFLSHILLCYLLTPFFQRVRKSSGKGLQTGIALLIAALQFVAASAFGGNYVHFAGLLLYYLFYLYSADKSVIAHHRRIVFFSCLLGVCAMAIRMGFIIAGLDNRVPLIYEVLVVPYSQLLLGTMIFVLVYSVIGGLYPRLVRHTALIHWTRKLSNYSMDIYIVHYMAICGGFSTILKSIFNHTLLFYFFSAVVFCAVYALVLHFLSGRIHKCIRV